MRKRKYYSLLFSLGLFLTLNVPSVKIFYSSEIINIFAFFMVWFIGLTRTIILDKGIIKFYEHKKIVLFLFLLMWYIIFIVTILKVPNNMSFRFYSEYFIVILFFVGVLLFTKEEDISNVIYIQIFWAVVLSILTVTIGINLDRSLGQHYLTLGVPIGAGIVSSLSVILLKDKKFSFNVWVILALIVSIIAISSLRGRSPLILSFIVPMIIGLLTLIFEKKLKLKIKNGILYSIFFIIISWFVYNNLSDVLLRRIINLQNFLETEERFRVYSISLDIIKNNPLGIGLKNSVNYGIVYPHNIFLEIFISGGIGAMVMFIFVIISVARNVLHSIKQQSYSICALSIFLFYFFTWNVSFDLSSSYIPFTALAIMIASVSRYRIGDEKNE
jgi:hypothetical protein